MVKKKKTVGAQARELLLQAPEKNDAVETQRAMQKDFIKNMEETIETGKKERIGSFYVVVLTKRERLMPNVIRDFFFHRITCPTPDYDQTVFYYDRQADTQSFLWTIPSQEAVEYLYLNAVEARKDHPHLVDFVIDFKQGDLLKKAKKMNNETPDQGVLILGDA